MSGESGYIRRSLSVTGSEIWCLFLCMDMMETKFLLQIKWYGTTPYLTSI